MNGRYHWDNERSLATINRSPNARDYPTPDEVKQWMAGSSVPYTEEPDRCLSCGRAEQCECVDCRFCTDGIPDHNLWTTDDLERALDDLFDPNNPTGTE